MYLTSHYNRPKEAGRWRKVAGRRQEGGGRWRKEAGRRQEGGRKEAGRRQERWRKVEFVFIKYVLLRV